MTEETQGDGVIVVSSELIHRILSVHFQDWMFKVPIAVVDLQRTEETYNVCLEILEKDEGLSVGKVSERLKAAVNNKKKVSKEDSKVVKELGS